MKRLRSIFIFSTLCVLSFFSSCNKKIVPASEFTPYISAYTGNLIQPSSTIQIELANEQSGVEANTEVKNKLFSFSPSLKGKTYWVNNRTIEFVPEQSALKDGVTYQAEFKLGKVVKTDKRHSIFYFSFKVQEKDFEMEEEPLDIASPEQIAVSGTIRFSDDTDLAVVKKAFSAKISDNQPLAPVIEKTDARTFHFTIADIQRAKTDLDLNITLNGKAFDVDKTLTRTIPIPALDVFKVLSTELITEPENGLRIIFSSPLSTSQDLRGLITLPELSDNFTLQTQNNRVIIYFDRSGVTNLTLNVNQGVKNTQGEKLQSAFSETFVLEILKPQVEMLKSGNIIPNSDNLILPFRAVNLTGVDLKIIKIYENNVLMFLQTNQLNGSDELRRSGRLVYKKTIQLDTKKAGQWQNYSIDLSTMMKQEPGAIYRIELSFKQEYSTYPCEDTHSTNTTNSDNLTQLSTGISEEEENSWDNPSPYYYNNNYDWDNYVWKERDNPCHPTYYMQSERRAVCNVMSSNIGVIAKSNSGNQWWISVANLLDTKPIANAEITLYSYQLQPLATVQTNSDGFAVANPKGNPFVLIASYNGQKTYLRLVDGEENSLSRFDVGGKIIEKGLKGYIYGERGVWRPGDTLHVTFVLYDPEKRIPENHPVSFELYNPNGQFAGKQIATQSVNGFYSFIVPTQANDPTGFWNAYVKVGGTSFHKSLRIETVKPNRLKINLSLPGERMDASAGSIPATLTSSWLTGATARNLKVKVEMKLSRTNIQFKGYENYTFNNPTSSFTSSETDIFNGTLNDNGAVQFAFKTPKAEEAPGMLNANIICRVFEQGGDASLYTQSTPYSPFSSYVGIRFNQKENQVFDTDTDQRFDVVTLNADGKPVNRDRLEYKIYKIGWSWWWQNNSETLGNYINNSSYTPVAQGDLKITNGKGSLSFRVNYPDWGRFFIYVKDRESGHATGGTIFMDWPEWRGRSNKNDPDNIKMLSFSTDKTSYEVGENVTVIIPDSGGGTALVGLENGSTVLNRAWVSLAEKGDTKYTFQATKEMSPNFYIHITLLQPHAQTANDLPIRIYGVMPVLISNKESVLNPQINMPDVLRPETEFTVEVSEKNGKPMTYTLAIVDDGLLDLTNFKTPNPWNEFYAREALGIRTWDMYDYVLGAFSGKYSAMFSVGGDETLNPSKNKANRFKPVVKYLGPFALGKGDTKKHKITLPMYVGSVRTMVVAGQDGAYGQAEKTTPVRSPLMVLSSLPRVISTNEEISLPVNVFAMENTVKDVSVKVETTGLLQAMEKNSQSVRFAQPGDQIVYFPLKTGAKTGIERVTITATGGGKTSKETIEIEVRNPNPVVVLSDNQIINTGQSADFQYQLTGVSADDWVKMEVSRLPSVNLIGRFDFLYNYEHFCSEQLTSRALPLLFISQLKETDKDETNKIKQNVTAAIKNLYGRQLTNGGIVYWPNENSVDEWITSYAGSFLVLAKEKGYDVNDGVLNKWKAYQRKAALNWTPQANSEYQQAYRLYTLALAGASELGAMNRMKEMKDLSTQSRWCLAAAYALDGKKKPAEELIFNVPTTVAPYYSAYTYGSSDRDEALILQTLVLLGQLDQAFKQAQQLAQNLSKQRYFDTQSTAFALLAMGYLAEKTSGTIQCDWTLNGKKQSEIRSAKASYQMQLPQKPEQGNLTLTNSGKGVVYVNLISKSRPITDTFPAISNNLKLDVSYTDLSGKPINVSEIKQGDDFMASVKVSNTSALQDYTNLALTHIIPSGWEIFNERMTSGGDETAVFTYQDIRDDRVLTYFDLPKGKFKTIKVRLQASYTGSFVLPAILCEAMYDTSVQARTQAERTTVIK
ncbi:hypothetical protein AGMMS50262_19120 [Bacteroidia bacterium]|nr:hypothetical protein AGMMS50262_19120 [Bacteroidia bacterium]